MAVTISCPQQKTRLNPPTCDVKDPLETGIGTFTVFGEAVNGGETAEKVVAKCYWGLLEEPPEAPHPNDPRIRTYLLAPEDPFWSFCDDPIPQARCSVATPHPTNTIVVWAYFSTQPMQFALVHFRGKSANTSECDASCPGSSSSSSSYYLGTSSTPAPPARRKASATRKSPSAKKPARSPRKNPRKA